ncbi:hypothetical protein [Dactylosporangium sp. CS-033363]|uniref:hypothetical protein n=1 Tax=Dactylosporangium sp. CS-033363 TaxID=3239935 RepID=UPI003D8F4EBE
MTVPHDDRNPIPGSGVPEDEQPPRTGDADVDLDRQVRDPLSIDPEADDIAATRTATPLEPPD